jgi:hypothetical protein
VTALLRWVVVVLAVLGVLLCVLGLTSTTRAPRLGIETPNGLSVQQLARVTTVDALGDALVRLTGGSGAALGLATAPLPAE